MTHHRPMFPPPGGVRPVSLFDIAVRDLQTTLDLARLRREAEQEVERLLTFLDMTDGYSMTEVEPSLTGYSDGMDDREGDCEDEGAQCDDEGDLGDSGIADKDGLMEQLAGNPRYLTGVQLWVE